LEFFPLRMTRKSFGKRGSCTMRVNIQALVVAAQGFEGQQESPHRPIRLLAVRREA
jgi:hypothetical protein